MKTSWLYATLLPLFLFSCALPEKQCPWKDGIPNVRRVPLYSNVSVPCPGFTAEEMTFTLHRGDDKFASITYGNMSLIRSQENLGRILEHSVNSSDNTTNFILLNVTLNATGLYTCMAEKAYPPPLVKIPEQPQIIVIVEEHGCTHARHIVEPPTNHLPFWVGFGALSIYGLIITFIALSLRFRLKREDMSSHDYMNMKPRGWRKKQGINHPNHLSLYNDTAKGAAVNKKLQSKGTSV
ncbi:T-cell-specific surface glycoprotein CD28 [Clarias gariepinus]|uniref:T-cell-specific surface glycoprotein CD28 n=1 Tax=Clarias gariepinus TaxID=13013 RepID=UPI00234C77E6|nr:T-cell-specific surface glycoprotein CD28 [Clarias gariepinus]